MRKRSETALALAIGAAGVAMLTLDARTAIVMALSPMVPTWGGVLVFLAMLVVGSWWTYECYQYVMEELVCGNLTLERGRPSVRDRKYR